ncbi:MAG: AraC family transcriptional regulator [Sphingomonadaceae bacterium]|jgi:AraC family transcriptional regulator
MSATASAQATVHVENELRGENLTAQLVRFEIPEPTRSVVTYPDVYQIDMCLTPRPTGSRAGYFRRWGPHRWERPGDIFMIPPGEELRFIAGKSQQNSLICMLRPGLVHQVAGRELTWDPAQLETTLDVANARIRAVLFRLAEEVRHPGLASGDLLDFLAGELAVELSRFCLEAAERPVSGGLAGWRLRLIDERIENEARAPSLGELAEICNLSVRQLSRGFRVSRGSSVGEYVDQRRMERAKRMLMAGESVKQIAFALGFASPSSFTFAFRRAVGSSPSHFRQRQLRGLQSA